MAQTGLAEMRGCTIESLFSHYARKGTDLDSHGRGGHRGGPEAFWDKVRGRTPF